LWAENDGNQTKHQFRQEEGKFLFPVTNHRIVQNVSHSTI